MYELKNDDYNTLKSVIENEFKVTSKSPHSKSFYNSDDIDWGYKPEGSLRISDHWNFRGSCETHDEVENNTHLSVGKYRDGKYDIIHSFEVLSNLANGDYTFKTMEYNNGEFLEVENIGGLSHFHDTNLHFYANPYGAYNDVLFYTKTNSKRESIIVDVIEFQFVKYNLESIGNFERTLDFKRRLTDLAYEKELAEKVFKVLINKRTKLETKLKKVKELGFELKRYKNGVEIECGTN